MKKLIIGAVMFLGLICLMCGCSKVDKVSTISVATSTTMIATPLTVATPVTLANGSTQVATATTSITTTNTTTTEKTTETTTTLEYLVFNPDSKRIHRSNCTYVDESMERVDGNYVKEGRACQVCKPDVIIDTVYTESVEVEQVESYSNEYSIDESSQYVPEVQNASPKTSSNGCLTARKGVHYGPSGKETYYNLNMGGCVSIMRGLGYSESEYPVWTDSRNVKYFGDYIMVAADLNTRPKGTLVETSLGTGIVVDTGGFAASNPTQIDIACNW